MELFSKILQFILCISILVILHEFGHYITARWFKMRVEKFFLFFDWPSKIFSRKIGETEWGIGMLPFGGYVKISGMIDESMDKEQLKQEPQPWEFRSKPAWQRLIVMLGGITVNFFLAWFIYTCVFATYGNKFIKADVYEKNGNYFSESWKKAGFEDGDKILTVDGKAQPNLERKLIDILIADKVKVLRQNKEVEIQFTDENKKHLLSELKNGLPFSPIGQKMEVETVADSSVAHKSGAQKGDIIYSVNGKILQNTFEVTKAFRTLANDSVKVGVIRNQDTITLKGKLNKDAVFGIMYKGLDKNNLFTTEKHTFFSAVGPAFDETIQKLIYQIKQFKLILKPKTEAYKQVKGPIGIVQIFDASWNWELFWKFTAMFSVWLAFLNILPIPGLDGGHALFTIAEMITGKKLSDKTMGIVQTIGMIILLSLMAIIFGKDIYDLIVANFSK